MRCVQNRARLVRSLYERLDSLEAPLAPEGIVPVAGRLPPVGTAGVTDDGEGGWPGMAILSLSVEQADQAPREPWEGEAETLDAAAGAGRRAAAWVRTLPAPRPTGGSSARTPTPSRR